MGDHQHAVSDQQDRYVFTLPPLCRPAARTVDQLTLRTVRVTGVVGVSTRARLLKDLPGGGRNFVPISPRYWVHPLHGPRVEARQEDPAGVESGQPDAETVQSFERRCVVGVADLIGTGWRAEPATLARALASVAFIAFGL